MQLKSILRQSAAVLLFFGLLSTSSAEEVPTLAQLRASLFEKPTALKPSLIDGYYGVYFGSDDPGAFVDAKLNIYGNSFTGYRFLSGARLEQDLRPQEASALFRRMLKAIRKERLPTYQFGSGQKEIFLFTAYDCSNCRALEKELTKRARTINATVYIVPTALDYSQTPNARHLLRGVLCAPNRAAAWTSLIMEGSAPMERGCDVDPADYAFLSLAFPNAFPRSVPTAVTMDGRVYTMVLEAFNRIFAEP